MPPGGLHRFLGAESGRHGIGCPIGEAFGIIEREGVTQAGGVPTIAYYHSYWQLAPDEALVVEVTPPECDYWNFQLANHWLESLDYRYFTVHINSYTATPRADGSIRAVIAHEDPGVDNWLNTCGHAQGAMCWRWIRAVEHPQPRTRVVKVAELRGE